MHLHKYEKIWLVFGISMIVLFLVLLGVGTFAQGMQPPGDHHAHAQGIDPETVLKTPPFNQPGLKKIGENEYEAYIVAQVFNFLPAKMEFPAGAKVHFKVTSPDVVHGLQIVGTNVNMMAIPGEVNTLTYTFKQSGEYLILCNEYCGAGHEIMGTTIAVK